MAIAEGNTAVQDDNGSSDWVQLSRGLNRLLISCENWSASVVTLQYSDDGETAYEALLDSELEPMEVSTTNKAFELAGVAGYVRITVASYNDPVTLKVINSIDNRL